MKTLKWIAVLPISILAMGLSYFIVRLFLMLVIDVWIFQLDSEISTKIIIALSSSVSTAIFLLTGYRLAPNYKIETLIIMSIIILICSGASLFVVNFIAKDYLLNLRIAMDLMAVVLVLYFLIKKNLSKSVPLFKKK